jgi:hypothetical protein
VCVAGGVGANRRARWQQDQASDQASLLRIPVRLCGYLALRAGPGRLEPGLGLGADILQVSVASASPASGAAGTHFAPFASLALGYVLPLGRHLYVRAMARGGGAVPYHFLTVAGGAEVWSTPRTYLELGVESGVFFP